MASFDLRVLAMSDELQGFCYATDERAGSGRDTDIVVVTSRANSFDQVGVHCRDGGKRPYRRCTHDCRIARSSIHRRGGEDVEVEGGWAVERCTARINPGM